MFEWSEEQLMIRDAVRQFVEAEIAPKREELEHGDLPPYDILRKLFSTFGMDVMARDLLVVSLGVDFAHTRSARQSANAVAAQNAGDAGV